MSEGGRCAMRGHCGLSQNFREVPCPYDGPPVEPEDDVFRSMLVDVCGSEYDNGPVCCSAEQVETLNDNFRLVGNIIGSCPACHNNFRSFFCSFTCSPDQSSFVSVTSTQLTLDERVAVKSLDFYLGQDFASGFFKSCNGVKMGAANDYAMTFIGGGAKNATAFLKFLGDEKTPGSPFQIDFSYSAPPELGQYNPVPRNCADEGLDSRCTCTDCDDVCVDLDPIPPPGAGPSCRVGAISCLSFILTNIYAIIVVVCFLTYIVKLAIRRRKDKKYERLALAGEDPSDNPLSPRSHSRSLVGASSLTRQTDGGGSPGEQSGDSRHLGRGASLLDPIETLQPRQYRLNVILRRTFYRLGLICASYPWLTFAFVLTAVGLLNIGWKNFNIERDPVRLWVAPNSESKLQKEFFDENFGPFYRPQQIFATSLPLRVPTNATLANRTVVPGSIDDSDLPPVLTWNHLKWWLTIEAHIRSLRSPEGYGLTDVCFKPSGPRTPCVVQSISAWFPDELETYEDSWRERIIECAAAPADCLPDYLQPLHPQFILGGLPTKVEKMDPQDWLDSIALVTTIVVNNSLDAEMQQKAMAWERTLRSYLEQLSRSAPWDAGLQLAFSTGVSLEEELNKSTNTDVKIVVLSYLIMFFYVAFSLGNNHVTSDEEGVFSSIYRWAINLPSYFRNKLSTTSAYLDDATEAPRLLPQLPRALFINSKFTLGLFGIGLVILSVSASIGLFSAIGVKSTLIIAEVIPFLVLAVGVDNVFILVHELERQNLLHGPNASANPQAFGPGSAATTAISPGHIRPSPFSSTHDGSVDAVSVPLHFPPEERVARALAKMGPSILLSTITETTAFSLGALVPMPAVRNFALYAAGSVFLNAVLQVTVFVSALTIDLYRVEASRADCLPCIRLPPRIALLDHPPTGASIGRVARFIRRRYSPFILQPVVKGIILLGFGGTFVGSIISMQHIQLGLDQRLALPSDSYLIDWFDALDKYYEVGPPLFFVAKDVDVSGRIGQKHLCGRFTTCDDYSLANILEGERKRREVSFMSEPTASWIDDYFYWLNPDSSCCRVRKSNPDVFCRPRDSPNLCRPCIENWNITMSGLPEGDEFAKYMAQWLRSPANEDCPIGGLAAYSSAIHLDEDARVRASHFRTFHSPLKSQDDFINSFTAAHRIADDITQRTGVTVFPYSLHYVFFDQYAHIIAITQEILGLGLAAVLVITALLLGSWRTGSIVAGVVALTVITVMGIMGLWGISLNAISLVNLVISLGIAVEFCAHIARAFMGAGTGLPVDQYSEQKERDERVWTALVDVGPSVLSGITFTKLIGISVLALTRSRLLEIYYFRMWFTLIISGALHGLVLLPVVLSYAGGPGYSLDDADEEWMSSTIRRRDYEYTPFLADDDSVHSD